MRPKYVTPAIVLARIPHGEANALVTLLTADFGLIRARAQGVRKSGAKLAASLRTLSELDASVLYGKEGWRLSGASLVEDHFSNLDAVSRARAGRISSLILRLVRGETAEPELFFAIKDFLSSLPGEDEETQDALECRTALRLVSALGLDAGEIPALEEVQTSRKAIVARINTGIAASGL
ncbi:recombination protein O N-terminal domain-containing protein [Patescibacteria group bacterium]|nr:recombination protein O N-terminal domain-containing protein [Patescibacteria group bacterium]